MKNERQTPTEPTDKLNPSFLDCSSHFAVVCGFVVLFRHTAVVWMFLTQVFVLIKLRI